MPLYQRPSQTWNKQLERISNTYVKIVQRIKKGLSGLESRQAHFSVESWLCYFSICFRVDKLRFVFAIHLRLCALDLRSTSCPMF